MESGTGPRFRGWWPAHQHSQLFNTAAGYVDYVVSLDGHVWLFGAQMFFREMQLLQSPGVLRTIVVHPQMRTCWPSRRGDDSQPVTPFMS